MVIQSSGSPLFPRQISRAKSQWKHSKNLARSEAHFKEMQNKPVAPWPRSGQLVLLTTL